PLVRLLTKKALRPTDEEVEINPRARSARLRAMEKYGEAEVQR
ncbi:MAG: 16S rRNA (cytosine(1402)-N(4))-methyltransferase, partial [Syntrophobacteraceae bacterium]|nr:16S rRNA (cytosine(1402)-N(4))-methyltransferase [Syntrophobacteraceae bacterium]